MGRLVVFIFALLLAPTGVAWPEEGGKPYSFSLPAGWRDISEPDVVHYESADRSQQLTVAEYLLKTKPSPAELRTLLDRYIEIRRRAELQLANGDATFESPSYTLESFTLKAEYWGARHASSFHFATIIYATPNRIVSWRFESADGAALKQTVSRVKSTIKVQ